MMEAKKMNDLGIETNMMAANTERDFHAPLHE